MNKRPELDFWTSVFTNADSADTPEGSMEECQNLRPLPGKLVKTYGAGSKTGVCPILITGWTVINIHAYINQNLIDGYTYVAMIREDASPYEVRVVWFVPDYSPLEGEPLKLAPFGADSFWMRVTDSQDLIEAGFALIMSTVFTETGTPPLATHTFPIGSSWHKPNEITGGDTLSIFGDLPADVGLAYNYEEQIYTNSDTDPIIVNDTQDYFDSHIEFNGRVKDFYVAGYAYAEVMHITRFSGTTYVAVQGKRSDGDNSDKLFYYAGGWLEYDWADLYTFAGTDTLFINGMKEFNGFLYVSVTFYDQSATGVELNHELWQINTTAFSTSSKIYTEAVALAATPYLYGTPGSVTMEIGNYTGVDNLMVFHAGIATAGTVPVGLLKAHPTIGGEATITLPTLASHTYTTVGIFRDEQQDLISLIVTQDDGAGAPLARLITLDTLVPAWTEESLPTEISRIGASIVWKEIYYADSYTHNGVTSRVFFARVKDGASAETIHIVTVETGADFVAAGNASGMASADTPTGLFIFNHAARTSPKILYSRLSGSTNYISSIDINSPTDDADVLESKAVATNYYRAFESYEIVNNHMSSIVLLYGEREEVLYHPTMFKMHCIGANPAWVSWDTTMTFNYTQTACVGWTLAVAGNLPTLYHKNAQNPIVLDKGVLRLYAGAVGEIGGVEAKGLWIGYIDRDFYDELYSPAAGFIAYDKTPLTPIGYTNTDTVGTDLSLDGFSTAETTRYVRYSFIYDGVNESLLSPVITTDIKDLTDRATFRLKLFDGTDDDVRDNKRITGIRIYLMDSGNESAVAVLVTEIPFTLKASDRETYSANGRALSTAWINEDQIGSLTSGTVVVGVTYRVRAYVAGDDFTNVGAASNATGIEFVATGTTPTTWTNASQLVIIPAVGNFFGSADAAANYKEITVVEDMGVDGWVMTIDGTNTGGGYNDDWFLSITGLDTSEIATAATGGFSGQNVLIDTSVDFEALNPLGLTVAAVDATGNQAFTVAAPSTRTLEVTAVYKYALAIDNLANTIETFKYHLGAHPYVFYTNSVYYSLFAVLDFLNTDGGVYGLQGVRYIKVNPAFAKIMSGRMFTLANILDPGGNNESQLASLCYSEKEQYDVIPVGNLIKFNDREGGGGTGLEELFGRPVVAFKQGLSILVVSDPTPSNWTISESPHNIGNIAPQGMVSALGTVYVCYYDGIYGLTANNLAETDRTPTERLKITTKIEDKYLALSQSQKEAIVGEYDQSKNEILWQLGAEQWAYSTNDQSWREIVQYRTGVTPTTIDIITIDENADLMFYDEGDGAVRSFTKPAAVASLMKSKVYNIATERDELLRYMWVFNPYSDAMTITPYMDGVALSTTVVAASTAKQKIVIKKRGLNFQVQVSWASSTNDNQLLRVVLEYDN